jgi:hypothetical protein
MKLIEIIHEFDGYREVAETDIDEKILKRIRKWRDSELVKSDWTQLPDSVCDKIKWATYRELLRDLPASNSDPRLIEMPNVTNKL